MTAPHSPAYRPATITTRTHGSAVAVVTVDGEVDCTNVDELISAATRVDDDGSRIILDLSGVEFFGSAGFSALQTLRERFAARAVTWAVVPSRNVDRVVRICDTESILPLHVDLAAAIESA